MCSLTIATSSVGSVDEINPSSVTRSGDGGSNAMPSSARTIVGVPQPMSAVGRNTK